MRGQVVLTLGAGCVLAAQPSAWLLAELNLLTSAPRPLPSFPHPSFTCLAVSNDAPHCACVTRQLSGLVGRGLQLHQHLMMQDSSRDSRDRDTHRDSRDTHQAGHNHTQSTTGRCRDKKQLHQRFRLHNSLVTHSATAITHRHTGLN